MIMLLYHVLWWTDLLHGIAHARYLASLLQLEIVLVAVIVD